MVAADSVNKFSVSASAAELPQVIKTVAPEYPKEAPEGIVQLQALVGKDGLVQDVKVTQSPSPLLSQAAEDALRKWVFKPPVAHGKPTDVWVVVHLTFRR